MADERTQRYVKAPGEMSARSRPEEPSLFGDGPGGTRLPGSDIPRRDFLKLSGFSLAAIAAGAAGCVRGPVEEAIPLLLPHPEMVPGRSSWYATTCHGCSAACGAVAKSRDGRPIKLEGNRLHGLSGGGLCAVGQATLLELYDGQRLRSPIWRGSATDWSSIDGRIAEHLRKAEADGSAVRLLTETVNSPSERAAIGRFGRRFENFRHVTYDPLSCSAIPDAHERTHGARRLPHYRFDAAEVIVSFGADFLGTWISPVEFTAGYRAGRRLDAEPPAMSYHFQAESRLSLTGSNADRRVTIHPEETAALLQELAAAVGVLAGEPAGFPFPDKAEGTEHPEDTRLDGLAERLWHARGRSLVLSDSQDVRVQVLCNLLNELLGNYGSTLSLERPSYQKLGDDRALAELRRELEAGEVEVLLVRGVNPVYELARGGELGKDLERVPLTVSFARAVDETASRCVAICPEHHFLEDWRDCEPVAGHLSVTQPLIYPLGDTRGFSPSLLVWSGERVESREWVERVWRDEILGRSEAESFQALWDGAVHDGYVEVAPIAPVAPIGGEAAAPFVGATAAASTQVSDPRAFEPVDPGHAASEELALVLYPKVGMLDGRHAHNAWLQELPDPVTKISWDNYASFAPATAAAVGVEDGDLIEVRAGGHTRDQPAPLTLPAHVQPGQHPGVVAVALGYGRSGTDRFRDLGPKWLERRPTVEAGETVGVRAADWQGDIDGRIAPSGRNVSVRPAGGRRPLASIQTYHDLEVPEHLRPSDGGTREVVQETVLPAYVKDRGAGKPHAHEFDANLWRPYPEGEHHWAMAIDLSACTGCSACVIACQVENNVPAVGRDEIRRQRDMYWMRIDRYYSERSERAEREADVDVVHQPMLCHHCDNAPCETVCPVAATVHSEEGLNQQVYNRCVGTRYCANNCPFKVRRFNWFDYSRDDPTENLVLNPDVTVRSRGVMEKCSFCVQRIQGAKIAAKSERRELADGEITTACQQSCPANAIVFGDTTDPDSEISRAIAGPRHYRLFEDLNILPSVGYQRLVRNRDDETGRDHHG